MRALLSNKSVNNLAVGVIVGYSVVNFVSSTVGMLYASIFDTITAPTTWDWNMFFGSLAVLVAGLLAGWLVNKQAE